MIEKTKDYDIFIFRNDNREKIDQAHVIKLINSIKCKNMLDISPIIVNSKMEVIDGQHRLLAAKSLGVDIYYQKEKKIDPRDIIRLNISKPWSMADYLNFYCNHQFDEYIKLKRFMEKHGLSLQLALNIAIGSGHFVHDVFRLGEFKFEEEALDTELEICWDTISYIKKMNGYSPYTRSARFWKALLKLVRHGGFNPDKWRQNIQKMVDHFTTKARSKDYMVLVSKIYNYRNDNKIHLEDEED